MLLRFTQICLPLDEDESLLSEKSAERLGISPSKIILLKIIRKSLDARKKDRIHYVYTLTVEVDEKDISNSVLDHPDIKLIEEEAPRIFPKLKTEKRPVIIGAGPAGLFAALRFTEYGLKPLILERGKEIEERVKDVERFWSDRVLNSESNVQFGEGGAGTFSDGKLTSRADNPASSYVLQTFVDAGADAEILYLAKPHIGTDRLRSIIVSMRKILIDRGCEIRFLSRVSDFGIHNGSVESVTVNDDYEIASHSIILAIGHSARDTYEKLFDLGVTMNSKSFAIGLRVEHPQALINGIQYGRSQGVAKLPPGEYVMTHNMKELGRSAYSFCMCPGGMIVNASSEAGRLVVNGMSNSNRNSPYANSALVVSVSPEDFGKDALAGIRFQRKWEEEAFKSGGGNYDAPAQNIIGFMDGEKDFSLKQSSFLPGIKGANLSACLPDFVGEALRMALPVFGRKMKGFMSSEATLVGVETRTSAPVRIMRGGDLQSVSTKGLYPCGEGAGYAGGIMSSAIDGIKVADAIAKELEQLSLP